MPEIEKSNLRVTDIMSEISAASAEQIVALVEHASAAADSL
jgi:hypothetical protein